MTEEEILAALKNGVARAEILHPVFAEGIWQGIGRISEEHGELAQAVNHNEGSERIREEALDLFIVTFRFLRGDYEKFEDDLK